MKITLLYSLLYILSFQNGKYVAGKMNLALEVLSVEFCKSGSIVFL